MTDLDYLLRAIYKRVRSEDGVELLKAVIIDAVKMRQKDEEERERILDEAFNESQSDRMYGGGE